MAEWDDATIMGKLDQLCAKIHAVDKAIDVAYSQTNQQHGEILRLLAEIKSKLPS